MSEYLVEVYFPRSPAVCATPDPEDVSRAADQITQEGEPVRLTRWILVPEDETCFYFFDAQSGEAVQKAATRSGLSFGRVVEAVSAWADPSGRARHTSSSQTKGESK